MSEIKTDENGFEYVEVEAGTMEPNCAKCILLPEEDEPCGRCIGSNPKSGKSYFQPKQSAPDASVVDDGGSVYPGYAVVDLPNDQTRTDPTPGISRRDWLAGMAMQGILGSADGLELEAIRKEGDEFGDTVAELAYKVARAMIREGKA